MLARDERQFMYQLITHYVYRHSLQIDITDMSQARERPLGIFTISLQRVSSNNCSRERVRNRPYTKGWILLAHGSSLTRT